MLNKRRNMKRNYGIIRKVAVAVCALGMMAGTAWGQNYSNYRIEHKAGQWYDTGRGSYQSTYSRTERDPNNPYAEGMDTFDDTGGLDNNGYQKTHEYIEYIYTNPNRTITFWMPYYLISTHVICRYILYFYHYKILL